MNLGQIRSAMYAQADWAPETSPEALTRHRGFINRAYRDLALEAPFLFFEDELRVTAEPDVLSLSTSDTIQMSGNNDLASAAADPWTFETVYTKTAADAATTTYTSTWKTDRSWDAREIVITTSTGVKHRNQIRAVWYDSSDDKWKFTIVNPWNWSENGTGPFTFRIYTDAYPFPDDIITMKSMRLYNNDQYFPLDVIGQDEAEQRSLVGPRNQTASGIPRIAYRRRHFQLEGPGVAPLVEKSKAATVGEGNAITVTYPWMGPERPGTFQYVVTYTWGKRDAEFRLPGLPKWDTYGGQWSNDGATVGKAPGNMTANNRIRPPRYESSPSPESAEVSTQVLTVEDPSLGLTAIHVKVPNIEYAMGFLTEHPSGSPSGARVSQHQSGLHVRIYRKRIETLEIVTDPYSGHTAAALGLVDGNVDNKSKFYLLAEMRIDELNQGVFIDDGQHIPDRSRPLRDIHGYQQYAMYPRPDARYEVDVRCLRRPAELEDDSDAPRVHAEATNCLISKATSYLYESMGNAEMAELLRMRYQDELAVVTKRYGDMRPPAVPIHRRAARVGRRRGSRKWWTTSSTS